VLCRGKKRPARAGIVAALLVALAAITALVGTAGAESESEATTFGADGVATQSLGVHLERTGVTGLVARPDDGLVAQQGSRLEAFLPSGAPDPAFSSIPATSEEGAGGLFPAAGGMSFVIDGGRLTRLDPEGATDMSFGHTGTAEIPSSTRAVGELGSGKIVAVTYDTIGARSPNFDVGVTVLNADGSPDGPEARSGAVSPSYTSKVVSEIVPAPDGGGLVVGGDFLLRLNADGSADQGFGHQGLLSSRSTFVSARFLADGSIEAVGSGSIGKKSGTAILRFTAGGEPDQSFGTDGVRLYDLPGSFDVASWGADGSVILGGGEEATGSCPEKNCEEAPVLAAIDAAGNLDTSFGEGGVLRLSGLAGRPGPGGSRAEGVVALTRRPDGTIIAAGNAPPNESVAFLAAFSPAGTLLGSFGEGGIVRAPEPVPAEEEVDAFVPQPGGKVLAAGSTDVGIEEHAVLIRYDADGSLDRTFGAGAGFVSLPGDGREPRGLAIRNGKVLVAPYTYPHPTLQMVDADDGAPVSSFGADGKVRLRPREGYVQAVEFASDGDPVVLEHTAGGEPGGPVLIQRFGPDGKPDRAFGHDGRLKLRPPVHGLEPTALAAAPKGRILVGGFAGDRFVVARLLPDGRVDRRFGSRGWSLPRVRGSLGSMTMTRAGSHLLLAGVAGQDGHRAVLLRLDARGRLARAGGRRVRSAETESGAQATGVLATPAGVVVLLERVAEPVLEFTRGQPVLRPPLGESAHQIFRVAGTLSGARLIVGWVPLEEKAPFHLSRVSLEPSRSRRGPSPGRSAGAPAAPHL
jgi:uncharacterized delta-60 repeat protein